MTRAGRRPDYPPARRDDTADDFHGTRVPDPYRWLEDDSAPEVAAWAAAQNRLTRQALDASPHRAAAHARLTELWDTPAYGLPTRRGGRWFFTRNDGLQNQAVLYAQDGPGGEPRPLLDPNALSDDGTVALTGQSLSEDGAWLAYGLSEAGSDWQELRVRRVDTGEDLPDRIRWCKFASVAWRHDGAGFFYNRLPEPGSVPPEDESNYSSVWWHALGTPQAEDRLVFQRPDAKELSYWPIVTDDGAYLVLHVWRGTDPANRIYYRPIAGDADSDGEFVRLLDEADAAYGLIATDGPRFFFQTDLGAPRGRVIAIDIGDPARERWREVVPEGPDPIAHAACVAGRLAVVTMRDASHRLLIYELGGALVREVALPSAGSVGGLGGRPGDAELLLSLETFLAPASIYRYDVAADRLAPWAEARGGLPAERFVAEQVFVTSKDGTRVPLFLVRRRDVAPTGDAPTILYGYGGFNIILTPWFMRRWQPWLERGGVLAVANLRGGGEYGEEWHQAGILGRKQNVFDDFIAAAEWLAASGWTRPGRLAIEGGSNGGLLVAACLAQRPELFGAALCEVPVIDMLRYHRFTVGRYWVGEYGNAEADPEHFRFLSAYSPLHTLREGAAYPATLIATAESDDRVVPGHARKFAAALQAAAGEGSGPVLLRVEGRAGHGAGKPTAKQIDEAADMHAFLYEALGLDGEEWL